MSRFTQVGSFDGVTVDAPVPPDVPIVAVSASQKVVTLHVPDFDPAAVTVPVTLHAAYYSAAPDPALAPADALAAATFAGQAPFSGGGDVAISVDATPGTYAKVLVFAEFPA